MSKIKLIKLSFSLSGLLACLSSPLLAFDIERPEIKSFIDSMSEQHSVDPEMLSALLAKTDAREDILEAISRPAERVRPWHEYRKIFITNERINAGVKFWKEHADTLDQVSRDTGVPHEILVGIIGVETYYGRITGRYTVFQALATLGFDYPPRSKFFRRELEEFLLLATEQQLNLETTLGSYAGAMGAPQFIPSSYRAYASDNDKDGRIDLFNSWSDVIGSVANYFVRHRWQAGKPVISRARLAEGFSLDVPQRNTLKLTSTLSVLKAGGLKVQDKVQDSTPATFVRLDGVDKNEYWAAYHNFYVITRYNRSTMYALAVWQLGNAVAEQRRRDNED